MFKYFLIISLALTLSSAETLFKPCIPALDKNSTEIHYANCTKSPCPVRRGSNITINVKFIPDKDHKQLNNIMYYEFMGIRSNYPQVHGTDACKYMHSITENGKTGCPLKKGKAYYYEYTIFMKPNTPKVAKVKLHWGVQDRELHEDALCYEFFIAVI